MTRDDALLERVDTSWNELSELVAKLGPDGLARTGPDGWAVKDHLAHVAAWEHSLLALIEGRSSRRWVYTHRRKKWTRSTARY